MKNIISLTFIAFMAISHVNAQNKSDKKSAVMNTNIPKISEFPTGEENTGFAHYFTGKSWLAPLT